MNEGELAKIIYSRSDLKALGIKVGNSTLLRWEARAHFPRRIRMASTSVGWLVSEVEQWLKDRGSERGSYHYEDPE